MTFGTPLALLLLLLVPVAVVAYLLAQRRRSKYAVRFTNLDLLASVVDRTPGFRRHVPAAIYLLALAALFVAMARPHVDTSVPRDGTVILVSDVSGSMNATDIEPSRLGAAQSAAKSLVKQLPDGFRVSLISFSNNVQVRVLPTADRKAVNRAIDGLQPNGGTAMGEAILQALDVINQESALDQGVTPGAAPSPTPTPAATGDPSHPKAVIVLMSDGASNTGIDPVDAAGQAKDQGIPIYTVALGTPDGVAEVRDNAGRIRRVAVPPDPDTLKQVADATGAKFFDAPTAEDLQSIYRSLGQKIGSDTESRDITVAFVVPGVVLLIIAGGLSLLWFNRFP